MVTVVVCVALSFYYVGYQWGTQKELKRMVEYLNEGVALKDALVREFTRGRLRP